MSGEDTTELVENKGSESKVEGPVAAAGPTTEVGSPRFDLLLVSHNPAFNMVDHGLKSLMNFLHTGNIGRATDEALAKTWQEIYLKPGATPHEAFVRHGWESKELPFLELVVHNALQPELLPWGGAENEGVRFWIEFRGCLFEDLDGRFKNRLRDALNTRFDVKSRPFTGLREHLVVPPGEEATAAQRARKDRASPRVGTAVEEF